MKKTEILDIVQVDTIDGGERYQVIIEGTKFAKPSYGPMVFVEIRQGRGKIRAFQLGQANNVEEFVTIVKNTIDEHKNTTECG